MKRIVILLLASLSFCTNLLAQNNLQSADDLGRIALTPIIAGNANIPSYATSLVKNKLIQVVTQNGLGGSAIDQRFVITANLVEVSKEITTTAPPMVAIGIMPTLYIGDLETGNLYASCALPMINGVGTNETKAYMSAIRTMQIQGPSVTSFIEQGKAKIIEYYNSQIDFIISKAAALADQDRFDESIMVLLAVPDVCKEAYAKAMDMTATVFQKKIDKEGAILLNSATQAWNADLSYYGAETAAGYLSKIHPNSASFAGGYALSETIAKRVKELDTREWNFKMQQYKDERDLQNKRLDYGHDERMSMISAAKEVGVARAKQPITYNYTRVSWW